MPDTILCAAEPEPERFHHADKSDKAGFSVRLSFEADSALDEAAAEVRFKDFLDRLQVIKFAAYQRVDALLKHLDIPHDGYPQNQFAQDLTDHFKKWLSNQARELGAPFFAQPGRNDGDEEIVAEETGAVHALQGAATWTAPVPHKLGLTHVLRFNKADLQSDLVIVPFFDQAAPEPEYPIEDAKLDPFTFSYNSGLNGGTDRCRTSVIPALLHDETSLVDTKTGFVFGDGRGPDFHAALTRLEQKSGSLLAAFPALLSLEWPSVKTDNDGSQTDEEDIVVLRRLVWRAMTSLAASLDSVQVALLMPTPGAREGALVAPLVDILLAHLEDNKTLPDGRKLPSFSPLQVLTALRASTSGLAVFNEPDNHEARRVYANALARVSGLPAGPGEQTAPRIGLPLLEFLLRAFAEYANAEEALAIVDSLKETVFGNPKPGEPIAFSFAELEKRSGTLLNERLSADLAGIADAVQSEAGVEATVFRTLALGGKNGASIDAGFAAALTADHQQAVADLCTKAREEFRRLLADSFNGAEAVRQACSSVYADLLMSERPAGVDDLKTRLKEAALFRSRVDPTGTNALSPVVDILVNPGPAWFVKAADDAGLASLDADFARAVGELFPAAKQRFLPAHAPEALPLMLTVDQETTDLDEFNKQFAGIGILVRRSEVKEDTAGKQDWAYANLAELTIAPIGEGAVPKFDDPAIHPMQTVESDGRRQLFLEYAGLPFTTSAFEGTLPKGVEGGGKELAFYTVDYPADPAPFQKLPKLAYGAVFQIVGYVISKGGVLPAALQAAHDAPWTPEPVVSTAEFPPDPIQIPELPQRSVVQNFCYMRRTSIGRTLVTESLEGPKRIGVAVEGVQPLAVDYPRVGLSAVRDKDVFADLLRNTDGTAALDLPGANSELNLDLAAFWWWGGKGDLIVTLLQAPAAMPDVEEGLKSFAVPVAAAGAFDFLRFTFKHVQDEAGVSTFSVRATLQPGDAGPEVTFTPALGPEGKAQPIWLRLRLASDPDSARLSISFAGPAPRVRASSAASRRPADTLVLVAPDTATWRSALRASVRAQIEFPRSGYADFDRWLNNEKLREEAAAGKATLLGTFRDLLLTANIVRTLDETVAARLERLPDLAVAGLLVELTPLDSLRNAPGALVADAQLLGELRFVLPLRRLGTVLDSLDEMKAGDKLTLAGLLEQLDESLAIPLQIACAPAGKLILEGNANDLAVRVPEGMNVRLTARPLVPHRYFKAGDDFPSVIDERMEQLANGRFVDADASLGSKDAEYLIFEGVALTVESVIGPVAVQKPAAGRPWEMVVNREKNEWEELVKIALPHAHKPAGSARSYDVTLDPRILLASSRGWTWRQIGSVDISTQRWRFTGRPIYSWINPGRPANGAASKPIEEGGDRREELATFERQAFYDRDDLDADVKTVRLEPAPAPTNVLKVDWEKPSATLFRHRFSVRSRYAGAMANPPDSVALAWAPADPDEPDELQDWFRVAMLADRARIQLTRPQLRALIPLTTAIGEAITPPVLAVLQERPFEYGGLADRIGAEIRAGIGYEVKTLQGDDKKVEPADIRKEVGPDPRLDYRSLAVLKASGLVLHAEGPAGLTFDSSSAPAPAFPNSLYVLQPASLFTVEAPVSLEEYFLSVALRRYLDHRWLVNQVERARFAASWWLELTDAGQGLWLKTDAEDLPVCWFEEDRAAKVICVYLNPRVVDPSMRKHPKADKRLMLCRAPQDGSKLALLHVPLEDGRASLSLFSVPPAASQARLAGGGNLPVLLASADWSIPRDIKDVRLEVSPEAEVTVTSASPVTALNWTRTNKVFDNIFVRNPGKNEGKIVIGAEMGVRYADGIVFDAPGMKNVWALPEQWARSFPLHTQRHIGLLFTERSDGWGRPVEVVRSWHRLIGRYSKTVTPQKNAPNFVRLIEFETPAVIIGYLPGIVDPAVMPDVYQAGYFDLKAIGFDGKTAGAGSAVDEFQLSFFMRLIAGSATKAGLKSVILTMRRDDDSKNAVPLKIENTGKGLVFGFHLNFEYKLDDKIKLCTARTVHEDGSFDDAVEIKVDYKLLVGATQGLVLKMDGVSAGGGEQEGWLEISMLASRKAEFIHPERGNTAPLTFNWFFTGDDQAPEQAVSESRLRSMTEAQARIIAISPPIRVEGAA